MQTRKLFLLILLACTLYVTIWSTKVSADQCRRDQVITVEIQLGEEVYTNFFCRLPNWNYKSCLRKGNTECMGPEFTINETAVTIHTSSGDKAGKLEKTGDRHYKLTLN